MLKVGITGGIGSGKSTVAAIFALLGVPLYNADDEAKKLMNSNPVIRQQLIAAFGAETYTHDGLNRPWLSKKVFNDAEKLQQLNQIVHPIVIAHGINWMKQQQAAYTLKEAAIFFESGSAAGLDYIIGVYTPQAMRIQRVMKRDAIGRQEVLTRMSRQIDEELKMKLCNFVIVNNEQQLLIVGAWFAWSKLSGSKDDGAVTVPPASDTTAQAIPQSTDTSVQAIQPVAAPASLPKWKAYFRAFDNKEDALKKFKLYEGNTNPVILETKDSINYKFYIVFESAIADTARKVDSLRKLYIRPITLEKLP